MCVLRFCPAMPLEVLQRLTWNGTPRKSAISFASPRIVARHGPLLSHQFGWEVRLLDRLTGGAGVIASVPDTGRGPDHGRTMESCDDRQRMVVTVSWSRVRSSGFSYVVGLTIIGQGSGGWRADFGASTQFGCRPKPPSLTCSHAASRRDVSDGMAHTSLRPSLVTRDGPFIAFRRPRQVFPFV